MMHGLWTHTHQRHYCAAPLIKGPNTHKHTDTERHTIKRYTRWLKRVERHWKDDEFQKKDSKLRVINGYGNFE